MSTEVNTSTEKLIQQALAQHRSDETDMAKSTYAAVLKIEPQNTQVIHALGILHAQLQDYQQAYGYFSHACSIDPDNPHFLSSLANCLRLQGKDQAALATFMQALKIQPTLSLHNNLGLLYMQMNAHDQAIVQFKSALQLHPKYASSHYNLALCLVTQQQYETATQHLEYALSQDPKHIQALCQLGKIQQQAATYHHAIISYQKILALEPKHAVALQNIGLCYLRLEEDVKGLDYLERAFKFDPNLDDIHHNLACVYLHTRSYAKALKHWLSHSNRHKDRDTWYNIGVCQLYLGRYNDALDYFHHVLRDHPDDHATLVNIGACFLQQGIFDKATEYYTRAQNLDPQPSLAYILSSLNGDKQPSHAPESYVTDLFNQYAYNYDNHLKNVLSYTVPEHVVSIIKHAINPAHKSLDVLDLGCGTGLCGEALKPFCNSIIGVDLAQNMLDLAAKKSIYDQLYCLRIPEQLSIYPGVNCIIAGDVFPYMGALDSTFVWLEQQLESGSSVIFTVERATQGDYCLLKTARFAHSSDYIAKIAQQYSFHIAAYENVMLRTHQRDYVEGFCFCLTRT